MRVQPKKYRSKLNLFDKETGDTLRLEHQNVILEKGAIFPKPLEYEDVDKAVTEFVDKSLSMIINNKKIPTFTLFSNQRFSEYSQTWQHTDEQGNLYLNFKTINREKNPTFGNNQGQLWNIPGERKYTIKQQEVLDDNGEAHYEIYTMKQPYCVDLKYSINFVTNLFEEINNFNSLINRLFSARQHYIRPNGYFVPLILESIDDDTSYQIDTRRFYVQKITITCMAYIIEEKDFEVLSFPKRLRVGFEGEKLKKPLIEIEEVESDAEYETISLQLTFEPYMEKTVEFDIDCDINIEDIQVENISSYRIAVNGNTIYAEKGFELNEGDKIKIYIRSLNENKKSKLTFNGYNPNEKIAAKEEISDIVSRDKVDHEDIIVE